MPDFLDEKRREIEQRLEELEPMASEYERLRAALNALEGVQDDGAATARPARDRSRATGARGSGGSGQGERRRGRPAGSGTRSKEALELVRSRPGISIQDLAETMGIKQNYLYRVLPGLQKDGLVRKEGRGWFPQEAAG